MQPTLVNVLDYVGGTVTEHIDGGWLIYLSPLLRMRLKRDHHVLADSSTRITEEEMHAGTPLTCALYGMYHNTKGA